MPSEIASFVNEVAATVCGKTERAMTGASVRQRRGHRDVAVLRGGYTAWNAQRQATTAR